METAPSRSSSLGAALMVAEEENATATGGLAALLLEHFGGVGDRVQSARDHDPPRPILLAAQVRLDDPIDVRADVGTQFDRSVRVAGQHRLEDIRDAVH